MVANSAPPQVLHWMYSTHRQWRKGDKLFPATSARKVTPPQSASNNPPPLLQILPPPLGSWMETHVVISPGGVIRTGGFGSRGGLSFLATRNNTRQQREATPNNKQARCQHLKYDDPQTCVVGTPYIRPSNPQRLGPKIPVGSSLLPLCGSKWPSFGP